MVTNMRAESVLLKYHHGELLEHGMISILKYHYVPASFSSQKKNNLDHGDFHELRMIGFLKYHHGDFFDSRIINFLKYHHGDFHERR